MINKVDLNEENTTSLFCNREVLKNGIIRYFDNELKDMYDHNFYECDNVDEEMFNICNEYSLKRKEHHIKFILPSKCQYLEDKGFEHGVLLTMLKTSNDFGNKLNNQLTFKNIKQDDIYDDLLALEIKHFEKVYGTDFCKRKSNRIFLKAKEYDSCLNYFAAYYNDKIVASCSASFNQVIVCLDDLLVDEDYRHQYIATSLMKYVFGYYNVNMYLHADDDDTPKEMYSKLGFKTIMKTYEYLYVEDISLKPMTREMYHEYFKNYENDHDIYFDNNSYVEYVYSYDNVEAYINRQIEKNRKCFAIMSDGNMIGEIKLVDIEEKKRATLSIALRHKELKDKGYGTIAEKKIIKYAFEELDIPTIYADVILPNTRSQHVLEKIGFKLIDISDNRKHYVLNKNDYVY